ncbi:MAG: CPBP family intramembrane metalloprotease [Pirellulales bacterium]|nr:CPBP family intramembrane metalloprotease [Pirellulales bacterium]
MNDSSASTNVAPWLPADYWRLSRGPLASLLFIAPLLLVYEVGVVWLGSNMDRNGVDVWLRTILDWTGFGHYLLLPMLTVCILLAWHYTTRQPWRVPRGVLAAMAVESVVLAVCLRVLLQIQGALFPLPVASVGASVSGTLNNLIMFLGAGIYEELFFRLILLGATIWGLRKAGVAPKTSIVAAVVVTSLLFSAAHYVGPYRDQFCLFSFSFRFLAGVFFSVLFVYRGFGIAVGSHAGYDILIGLW